MASMRRLNLVLFCVALVLGPVVASDQLPPSLLEEGQRATVTHSAATQGACDVAQNGTCCGVTQCPYSNGVCCTKNGFCCPQGAMCVAHPNDADRMLCATFGDIVASPTVPNVTPMGPPNGGCSCSKGLELNYTSCCKTPAPTAPPTMPPVQIVLQPSMVLLVSPPSTPPPIVPVTREDVQIQVRPAPPVSLPPSQINSTYIRRSRVQLVRPLPSVSRLDRIIDRIVQPVIVAVPQPAPPAPTQPPSTLTIPITQTVFRHVPFNSTNGTSNSTGSGAGAATAEESTEEEDPNMSARAAKLKRDMESQLKQLDRQADGDGSEAVSKPRGDGAPDTDEGTGKAKKAAAGAAKTPAAAGGAVTQSSKKGNAGGGGGGGGNNNNKNDNDKQQRRLQKEKEKQQAQTVNLAGKPAASVATKQELKVTTPETKAQTTPAAAAQTQVQAQAQAKPQPTTSAQQPAVTQTLAANATVDQTRADKLKKDMEEALKQLDRQAVAEPERKLPVGAGPPEPPVKVKPQSQQSRHAHQVQLAREKAAAAQAANRTAGTPAAGTTTAAGTTATVTNAANTTANATVRTATTTATTTTRTMKFLATPLIHPANATQNTSGVPRTCTFWGHGHAVAFRGEQYEFYATGEYELFAGVAGPGRLPVRVHVATQSTDRAGRAVGVAISTSDGELAVRYEDLWLPHVTIRWNCHVLPLAPGETVRLGSFLKVKIIRLPFSHAAKYMMEVRYAKTNLLVSVLYGLPALAGLHWLDVQVTTDSSMLGRTAVSGMCGAAVGCVDSHHRPVDCRAMSPAVWRASKSLFTCRGVHSVPEAAHEPVGDLTAGVEHSPAARAHPKQFQKVVLECTQDGGLGWRACAAEILLLERHPQTVLREMQVLQFSTRRAHRRFSRR